MPKGIALGGNWTSTQVRENGMTGRGHTDSSGGRAECKGSRMQDLSSSIS